MTRAPATWSAYRGTIGDRSDLFAEVAREFAPRRALYPGSYVHLAPSTAIPEVVYVDTDARAERYFADADLVRAELAGRTLPGAATEVRFLALDFSAPLPVPDASVDLLISLYTGPALDHCRRYLRPGGLFLATSSHGDASLAAHDADLRLVAAVKRRDERHRLVTKDLERYLVAKRPDLDDPELTSRRCPGRVRAAPRSLPARRARPKRALLSGRVHATSPAPRLRPGTQPPPGPRRGRPTKSPQRTARPGYIQKQAEYGVNKAGLN